MFTASHDTDDYPLCIHTRTTMKLQGYLLAKQTFSTKYCSKCKPLTSNFIFLVKIYRVVEKELRTFIWIKVLQL